MQVREGGRSAAIGNVRHLDAGHLQEQHLGQERRAAGAGRCHRELAGLGLGEVDQLLDRMGRRGVRHEHEIGKLGDKRDRREIRNRIVAQRAVEAGVHRQRRGGEQDRVSVGIGARDVFVADVGAGASLVLDENLLAPHPRQLFGEHACDDIRRAAGGDRHNEAHGPIREIGSGRLRAPLPNEEVGRECLCDR